MIRRHLWLLAAAAWLGGCTLTAEYQRPAAPVPDQWPRGPAYADPAPHLHRYTDARCIANGYLHSYRYTCAESDTDADLNERH